MFDNYNTSKLFAETLTGLDEKTGKIFAKRVKNLYYAKATGDEEHAQYKITMKDLKRVIDSLNE